MLPQDVVPPEAGWMVTAGSITLDLIVIAVKPSQHSSDCPRWGVASNRIHSHYVRTTADLPWQGRRVILRVTVRRFRCPNRGCSQRIFCERLSHLAAWVQTTDRLSEAHRLIGLALGGEAGSRQTNHLAVPTSPDTLLRRVKRTPQHSHPTPRVLGVDDFAFRRGESYGTILMDLERRVVVDLLPDRTAGTLAAWLKAHPGVEVVSRDRVSAYAQAARDAAPHATQVADRLHLLMNLRKAVERSLARQSSAVREACQKQDEQEEYPEGVNASDSVHAGQSGPEATAKE
jgi:transposase